MLNEKDIQKLKKAGVPSYKKIFPPKTGRLFNNKIVGLIGGANRAIGNLNSYARIIPNPDLLIWPLLLKEALASSKIEGTQASIKDVLKKDANMKISTRHVDIQEVINHRESTKLGLKLLKKYPITGRSIKQTHQRLMQGLVRGSEKRIGEFRQGQNAIGREGDLSNIKYLPPPALEVADAIHRLEIYINSDDIEYDKLVSCAFIHYEFEAIHPFADGNGRIGRLLITLYLLKENVLRYPLIYPSAYFLHHKQEYENKLLRITTENDWKGWLEFFLRGIIEQANKSEKLIEGIDNLYQKAQDTARLHSQSPHTNKLVEIIFKKPIIRAPEAARDLDVKHRTAISLLRRFSHLGIISFDSKKKKNIPFANSKLINLLESA